MEVVSKTVISCLTYGAYNGQYNIKRTEYDLKVFLRIIFLFCKFKFFLIVGNLDFFLIFNVSWAFFVSVIQSLGTKS